MANGVQPALAHRSLPGDGLLWQHGGERWWWTDVPAATLYAWSETDRSPAAWRLPERAGSFAFCRSGRVLVGLAKWLCFAGLPGAAGAGKAARPLALQAAVAVDPAEPRTRVADGRTDRRGHFVFGTRIEAEEPRAIGSFYQYSQAHGLRRLALPAAAVAGSICFSPDGTTMYFSTGERRLMCCDYDADRAQVANLRPFAELAQAVPHGATVDSEGCVWNAEQGSGRLVRYAPDGERIGAWTLPAPWATRPAFGGAALDCLMVGSGAARHGGGRGSGTLFRLALPGVRGMPDMPFDDTDIP
jgi:L-arabinonolactonase